MSVLGHSQNCKIMKHLIRLHYKLTSNILYVWIYVCIYKYTPKIFLPLLLLTLSEVFLVWVHDYLLMLPATDGRCVAASAGRSRICWGWGQFGLVGHTILYSGWDWVVGHTKLCVVYITAPHVKCVGGEVMMVDCLQCNQSTIPPPLPAWIYISICSNNKKIGTSISRLDVFVFFNQTTFPLFWWWWDRKQNTTERWLSEILSNI